jgi:hypothetical protein
VLGAPVLLPIDQAMLAAPPAPRQRLHALVPPATGPPAVLRAATSPRGPPSASV